MRPFVLVVVLTACGRPSRSPSPPPPPVVVSAPVLSALISTPLVPALSSASAATSARQRVQHTLELVTEGPPGAEAIHAQIPALGLRERIATAETPFWCTVGSSRQVRPGLAPPSIEELHVRCGPDHLAIIRRNKEGLAIDGRLIPLPPDVDVALDPRQQPPLPARDCSAVKPRTLQMKLAWQRTPQGPELRLRATEMGLDFRLTPLFSIHECWTVHLPRAQRATLHCVTADHSRKDALWVEEDQLFIESTEAGIDGLGPARWAIRLPCNTRVRWSRFQYRGPESRRMPYERTLWRCETRCEELHHDERGELTSAGNACRQRCMDIYSKARFASP